MDDKSDQIRLLIDKAAAAEYADDALRFSQAAYNAANAMLALITAQQKQ